MEGRCFRRHNAYMAIGAATLFAVVVLLIWLFVDPQRRSTSATGGSCVELVDRFWKRPRHRPLTSVERQDMQRCHDVLKERWGRRELGQGEAQERPIFSCENSP